MNLLDLFIATPILLFAFRGYKNGLIREVFGITAVFIAVFISFRYMGTAAGLVTPLAENPDVAVILAGILLFTVTVVLVRTAGSWLESFITVIQLGILNRVAGLLFGALKAALVVSAVLLLASGFDLPGPEKRKASVSYPVVIYIAPAAYDLAAELYPGAENFIRTIENTLQEHNPLRTLPIFESLEFHS